MTYIENAVYAWTEDSVRCICMPSQLAKSTFFYVQEVGHFRTLPAYRTERASLRSYLICHTISGKGSLSVGQQTYVLGPGDTFFIDCMDHHSYETDAKEPWEILWIHFHGSMCAGYYELFRSQQTPIIATGPDSQIPGLIQRILDLQQRRDVMTELLASKLLMELLTEAVGHAISASTMSCIQPSWVSELTRQLDRKFREKITLENMSVYAAINKFQLSKEFKSFTGLTPNEYLIRNRITYAKELLTHSDHSVAEIAQMAGIDNVTHFINLFKAREELTPLAYRKKWRLNI